MATQSDQGLGAPNLADLVVMQAPPGAALGGPSGDQQPAVGKGAGGCVSCQGSISSFLKKCGGAVGSSSWMLYALIAIVIILVVYFVYKAKKKSGKTPDTYRTYQHPY